MSNELKIVIGKNLATNRWAMSIKNDSKSINFDFDEFDGPYPQCSLSKEDINNLISFLQLNLKDYEV